MASDQLSIPPEWLTTKREPSWITGEPVALHQTPIPWLLAFQMNGLPLPADARLVWEVTIDGETDDGWRAAFNTRPDPGPMRMAS